MTKRKGRNMKNSVTVRSNLESLITAKAQREGGRITISDIVAETRLSTNTVKRYLRGGEGGFDGHAVAVLCQYLGCEIGDLLEIVNGGKSAENNMTAEE